MPDPSASDRIATMKDWAGEDPHQLPYVSKSRMTKWLKCATKFQHRYVFGERGPETQPMVRGSIVHETYEKYYDNLAEHIEETGELPDDPWNLLPDSRLWGDFTEPYIAAFLAFEMRRYDYVDHPRRAIPVAVEAEGWIEAPLGIGDQLADINPDVEEAPWMGFADVILRADSLPEDIFEGDDGVVIIDHKTGKVPPEQYRNEGIYAELSYYAQVFKDEYDVAGTAVFYPRGGLSGECLSLTVGDMAKHTRTVRDAASALQFSTAEGSDESFPVAEQPLCQWSEDPSDACPYYEDCDSTWGEPARNPVKFRELVRRDADDEEIVEALDMNNNSSISYWKRKIA